MLKCQENSSLGAIILFIRIDPFTYGFVRQGSKQGVMKVVPHSKNDEQNRQEYSFILINTIIFRYLKVRLISNYCYFKVNSLISENLL